MCSRSRQMIPSTMLVICAAIPFLFCHFAKGAEVSDSLPDDAALLKMKVKDLKAILEKKGPDAACLACTSKQEYVSRIHETVDWPDITPEPEAAPVGDEPTMEDLRKMFSDSQNDERIAGLKKQLEEAGIDTSKIFTASGFDSEQILKDKEKWENLRDKMTAEEGDADGSAPEEEAKSDL